MSIANEKTVKRNRRHRRIRAMVSGTAGRPRLCVYKSNTRLIAQLIDDERGVVIAAVSSDKEAGSTPSERAQTAAASIAGAAKDAGIERVVFDRGGFQYTGTIRMFADAARGAGLAF